MASFRIRGLACLRTGLPLPPATPMMRKLKSPARILDDTWSHDRIWFLGDALMAIKVEAEPLTRHDRASARLGSPAVSNRKFGMDSKLLVRIRDTGNCSEGAHP